MPAKKHIVIDARIRRSTTGRYVAQLLEHLQTIDTFHHYTILVHPTDTWEPTAPNFQTLPCPYAQFSFNPLEQIGFARQLYRLKPDLVHFTMTQQPLLYFGNIATTTHDLTMLHFVRRGTTPKTVFALKMGLYRFLLRWSHTKSDIIIAPTKFVANDIEAYQPSTKGKTVVTYESGELPNAAIAEQLETVEPSTKFILYVGTHFPHKNLSKLIEAFDILHRKHPELHLIIVGKKDTHTIDLEERARKYPSKANIIFTGFVSDGALRWLFERCEAYVFPSLSEGWGLPPLEAMAYGAPVASSNATCLPEVYGDAAHYFDPHSAKDIAQKVSEILDDSTLRQTLVKNGYKQIKKYSWQHMAEETLLVYKKVLGETTDG